MPPLSPSLAGDPPAGLSPFDPAEDADPAREHDANGHYWAGPKLKQPSFRQLIGRQRRTATDAVREALLRAAEESREYRQSIPAPVVVPRDAHLPRGVKRFLHALEGKRTRVSRQRAA